MGNSGSRGPPPPPPRIDVDSYPYQTPATTDGVSISGSEECARCVLSVNRGTTTSSIRLERVFGPISKDQTIAYGNDLQDVKDRKMSLQDFLRKLQSGGYYRPVNDNYAEQVMFLDDDLKNIKAVTDVDSNAGKLQVTRIRKIAAGSVGYSEDTKLTIVPSVPFSYTFNGASVSVKMMTLYYPCPVRVENVQYDAVLSLGDPSETDSNFVLLVPVRAVANPNYASDQFFSKIASYIPGILHPKADASFDPVNVPTGSDWSISSILPVTGNAQGQPEVAGALYAWRGVPRKSLFPSVMTASNTRYGWYDKSLGLTPEQRRSLPASRQYIMLAEPIQVGSATISAIQALPVTPPEQAIDGVPSKGVFYKSVICPSKKEKASSNKEHFDNGENCDPFSTAPTPPPVDPNFLFSIIMGMLGAIAIFVGVYFAVSYAGGPGANVVKGFGEYLARAYVMIKKTTAPIQKEFKAVVESPIADTAETRLSSPLRETVPTKARDTTARVRPKEIRSLNQYKNSNLTQRNPRVPTTRPRDSKEVTDAELAAAAEARLAKSLNQPITIKAKKADDAAAGTGLLTPEQMRQAEAERVRMEREAKAKAEEENAGDASPVRRPLTKEERLARGLLTPEEEREAEAERVRMEREFKAKADAESKEEEAVADLARQHESRRANMAADAKTGLDKVNRDFAQKREEQATRARLEKSKALAVARTEEMKREKEAKAKADAEAAELARLEREHEREREEERNSLQANTPEASTPRSNRSEPDTEMTDRQFEEAMDEFHRIQAESLARQRVQPGRLPAVRPPPIGGPSQRATVAPTRAASPPAAPSRSVETDTDTESVAESTNTRYNPDRHHRRDVSHYDRGDPATLTSKSWRLTTKMAARLRGTPYDLNVKSGVDYKKNDLERQATKSLRRQFKTKAELLEKIGSVPLGMTIDDSLRVRFMSSGRARNLRETTRRV
jgi:hypothetical protein